MGERAPGVCGRASGAGGGQGSAFTEAKKQQWHDS